MRDATRAPAYACLYHGLCDVARKLGYALAIHGTLNVDLDLIAVPWVDEAVDAKTLVKALTDHIGACGYGDLLRRQGHTEEMVNQILARKENRDTDEAEVKPHGRRAWNLYMDAGAKVDLSVLPRVKDWSSAEYEEKARRWREEYGSP